MAASSALAVRRFSWKKIYRAAALEANNAGLEGRIGEAQRTLMGRLLELSSSQEDRVEVGAIEKALRTLWTIKSERLGHS
jgi:hypothetical protein